MLRFSEMCTTISTVALCHVKDGHFLNYLIHCNLPSSEFQFTRATDSTYISVCNVDIYIKHISM
jgi:hypothetical protein